MFLLKARCYLFVVAFLSYLPVKSGQSVTVLDGHVSIEVMSTLFSFDNGTCSDDIDVDVVQNLEAIRWILRKLQDDTSFMPGVKIGMRVHPTCRSEDIAKQVAGNLTTEMRGSSNINVVGVIGPDFSSEAEAVSRLLSSQPDKYRLLQIAHAPTAVSLKDKTVYSNFFRTIPADDIQIETMRLLLGRLNWTYLAAVYDDDSYGQGGVQTLISAIDSEYRCFPAQIPVDPNLADNEMRALMESNLRSLVLEREIPVEGFLVFGSSRLSSAILAAAEEVFKNETVPVFVFSEAGGYFVNQYKNVSGGSYILGPRKVFIQEFQNYWTSLFTNLSNLYNELPSNPWLRKAYNKIHPGCTLSQDFVSNNCPPLTESDVNFNLPPSIYNQYAIQAAMTLALVTKKVHETFCNDLPGSVCAAFLQAPRRAFLDVMDNLQVRFDEDFGSTRITEFKEPTSKDLVLRFDGSTEAILETPDLPLYEAYNHRQCESSSNIGNSDFCFVVVAKYSRVGQTPTLEMTTSAIRDYIRSTEMVWPDIRKAQCPDGHICEECIKPDTLSTLVIPGDLYIVGIAPVHSKGKTPVNCGPLKPGGFDVVESMKFAIREAKNNFPNEVPSGEIGAIIIDSCNDAQVIQEKVLSLHRNGVPEDPDAKNKILGFIGAWSSDVSVALAEILTRLHYVQISYGSTSPALSNVMDYPYFLRIPSSDIAQAETILKIIESIDTRYVQLLYTESAYGIGGRDLLVEKALDLEICIVNQIPVSDSMDTEQLISSLRKYQEINVVILWVASFDLTWLLPLLNGNFNRDQFIYVASEGLGTRNIISGLNNLEGAISVAIELPPNTKFIADLKELVPDGSPANSWLRGYIEQTFSCYYEWSFNKSSGMECSGAERLDTNTGFNVDTWVPFAENAIYALLKGSYSAMTVLCDGKTDKICSAYRTTPSTIVDKIKSVQLNLDRLSGTENVFDENGDGLTGYNIYVIRQSGNEMTYTRIGSNGATGGYTFNNEDWSAISRKAGIASCKNADICGQCVGTPTSPTPSPPSGLSSSIAVVIAILGVICCVLAAILLFICNRHGCCIKLENGKPSFTNTYLHPVYREGGARNGTELQDNYDFIQDRNTTHRVAPDGGPREVDAGNEPTSGFSGSGTGSQLSSGGRVWDSSGSTGGSKDGYLTTVVHE